MYKYIVFDVGCIECGEASENLGRFKTLQEAKDFIENYFDSNTSWGRKEWRGQHILGIYPIKGGDEIFE